MTSSPGAGDNSPCPGEQPNNGSSSSLQVNNNILLFNWTKERQNRLGRWRLKTGLCIMGTGWLTSDPRGQDLPGLLYLLQPGMRWDGRGVHSFHRQANLLPSFTSLPALRGQPPEPVQFWHALRVRQV